ncbi:MAG: S1C family serine protease [Vicinamibacteria bacterium]
MSAPARASLAAALAAGVLAVAGCGGGSEATTVTVGAASTTSTTGTGDAHRVVIQAEDGAFDPRAIYESAAPGVVTVISVFDNPGASIFGGGGAAGGQGSGFVISDDGEILTNAHVVTDAATTGSPSRPLHEASEIYVQFADRNQVEAEIVGFDPFADVALLKVDPEGLDLAPLSLGSETDVQVGDPVAAIGSPFGQNQSLSVGVVSATNRSIDSLTDFGIDGALQTDASINPGNSGGPLLDADGEVVGINQQIQTASGGNEGVGFAVPIDLAERAVEQLRDKGEVAYAYAGVTTQPLYPQLADRLGIDVDTGALVSEVVPNSPADDAGLQAGNEQIRFQGREVDAGGDVITAVNGETVTDNADLPRIVSRLNPGDVVTLDIIRDGDEDQIELTLGERPTTVR